MRTWVLRDYGTLALEEKPRPQDKELLIRVAAVGLCGSDLSVYKGTPAMRARWRPPLVLGHEISGVVEEGPADLIGKAVAVHPVIPCGRCVFCRSEKPNLCPHRLQVGFHLPGGLAEWIWVPQSQVYPLPPNLPLWKGALAEPLAVALHGVTCARPHEGEEALVLGGGAIGSLLAWLLRFLGLRVFLLEPNPKRARALETLDLAEAVLEGGKPLPKENFSLVLDTVGLEKSLLQALEACTPGGRVVLLGLGDLQAAVNLQDLVLKEKTVLGSYLFTPGEFAQAVELLSNLPDILVQLWPIDRTPYAFRALLEGRVPAPKLVLLW